MPLTNNGTSLLAARMLRLSQQHDSEQARKTLPILDHDPSRLHMGPAGNLDQAPALKDNSPRNTQCGSPPLRHSHTEHSLGTLADPLSGGLCVQGNVSLHLLLFACGLAGGI